MKSLVLFQIQFLSLALLIACQGKSINQRHGISEDIRQLAQESVAKFNTLPRSINSIREAFRDITRVINLVPKGTVERYEYYIFAAKYATWLSYHLDNKDEKSEFALQGMNFSQDAIGINKDRVEGFYFRAISIGLFAQQNKLSAKNSMHQIRKTLNIAIEIDPGFEHGGPHRVLGALYLRAPGPPMGLGSRQKAVFHLKKAVKIDNNYPENLLFLAEAYIKIGELSKADSLIWELPEYLSKSRDATERADWQKRLNEIIVVRENKK